eukprot:213670-Pleurochrysis_carterae.AAC.1
MQLHLHLVGARLAAEEGADVENVMAQQVAASCDRCRTLLGCGRVVSASLFLTSSAESDVAQRSGTRRESSYGMLQVIADDDLGEQGHDEITSCAAGDFL